MLDDDVISEDDFEEQKLKLTGSISLADGIKLADALRELKNLLEDEIISDDEFNVLKKTLMSN